MTNVSKAVEARESALLDYLRTSEEWLYRERVREPSEHYQRVLAIADINSLEMALNDDDKRKAFWINVYNAIVQNVLAAHPEHYKHRNSFFSGKLLTIAGTRLSLDEVEHGILRRSKNKFGFGYLNTLVPSTFEKKFRVEKLDYRIHFALNCGATSCPPIAFYSADRINEQLQTAMAVHLEAEALYDRENNRVTVPAFMGWFRADFGGKSGIRKLLRAIGIIPAACSPRIIFKKYDWNLYLDNFKEYHH